MTTQLKQMKGAEFVRKVLNGERDFSRISLEESFDLSGHEDFRNMQSYLMAQNLRVSPLNISNSKLRRVNARGLYLSYIKGTEAILDEANLSGANLREANLREANLRGAILYGTSLSGATLDRADLSGAILEGAALDRADLYRAILYRANLSGANLSEAGLSGANLREANLYRAILYRADLRKVIGLEKALDLASADFCNTKVTKKGERVIKEVLKENRRHLFFVIPHGLATGIKRQQRYKH